VLPDRRIAAARSRATPGGRPVGADPVARGERRSVGRSHQLPTARRDPAVHSVAPAAGGALTGRRPPGRRRQSRAGATVAGAPGLPPPPGTAPATTRRGGGRAQPPEVHHRLVRPRPRRRGTPPRPHSRPTTAYCSPQAVSGAPTNVPSPSSTAVSGHGRSRPSGPVGPSPRRHARRSGLRRRGAHRLLERRGRQRTPSGPRLPGAAAAVTIRLPSRPVSHAAG